MNIFLYLRVQALRNALDDEVHGLWISDEMAVKVLARLDAITENALKGAYENVIETGNSYGDPASI